jgi:thioredoxin
VRGEEAVEEALGADRLEDLDAPAALEPPRRPPKGPGRTALVGHAAQDANQEVGSPADARQRNGDMIEPGRGHRRPPSYSQGRRPVHRRGRFHHLKCGRTEQMSNEAPWLLHLDEKNYDEALVAAEGVMMVDFWAEWCGPCRAVGPVLEDLARTSGGTVTLAKVNVDENPGLAARYGIRSIPTILFVKDGKVQDQLIGAVPKPQIQAKLTAVSSK